MVLRNFRHIGVIVTAAVLLSPPAWAQHSTAKDAPCRKAADAAQCFLGAAQDANKALNENYNRIWKSLAARPKQQAQLKTAQDLWLRTRSADCEAERDVYEGGEAAQGFYYACLEAETRQRRNELQLMYGRRK